MPCHVRFVCCIDYQTRMLFNQNFSARFTSAKVFALERERQQARGWIAGGQGGAAAGENARGGNRSPPPEKQSPDRSSGVALPPPPVVVVSTRRSRRSSGTAGEFSRTKAS